VGGTTFDPIHLPDEAWRTPEIEHALRERDFRSIFQLARKYGITHERITVNSGVAAGRISEVKNGHRIIKSLDVMERIASGLNMPDHARVKLGLAPREYKESPSADEQSDDAMKRTCASCGNPLSRYNTQQLCQACVRSGREPASEPPRPQVSDRQGGRKTMAPAAPPKPLGAERDHDPVWLKVLLRRNHWQTYRTFCKEYDKAAVSIDPDLKGTWPSKANFHRWISGNLKTLPYPDHCRVLEAMFPGWTVEQLFERGKDNYPASGSQYDAIEDDSPHGVAELESSAAPALVVDENVMDGPNERLRVAIREANITLEDVARVASVDVKTVTRWLTKGRIPYRRHRDLVADYLGADAAELWPMVNVRKSVRVDHASADPLASPVPDDRETTQQGEQNLTSWPPIEWDEMERRLFLQLAASAGVGVAAAPNLGIEASQLLNLALSAEPRDIEEWELVCSDHLHALRTRPPAVAKQDLTLDLLALYRQLRTAGRNSTDLQRVRAALSTLHANLLTRLGEHGAAIRWWRTARDAADASGDLELRLGVRATEAGHGLFGQRSPDTVLRLTENAQGIVNGKPPSGGLAFVLISKAKALSALGRHDDARQVLSDCHDVLIRTPSATDIMSGYWITGNNEAESRLKLHFAESLVFAFAGDEAAADDAADNVIALTNGDYQIVPAVRLYQALCAVANGGIERGVRQATEIVGDLDKSQRTAMTREDAQVVLRAVPHENHRTPLVREFRTVLASTFDEPANQIAST
jgi:transcriptional regulator with XRE-family HTH domain